MLCLLLVSCWTHAAPDPETRMSGAYCLYVSLEALGVRTPGLAAIESNLGSAGASGYTMPQLSKAASSLGIQTLMVRTTLDHLARRDPPFACIAPISDSGRFVCVFDVDDQFVYLADPPRDVTMAREAFEASWGGEALLLSSRPLTPMGSFVRWRELVAVVAGVAVVVGVGVWGIARFRRGDEVGVVIDHA